VTVDDAAGSALAMEHFVELGHTAVAGIFGPGAIDTSRRRRAGFVAAGELAGIDAVLIDAPGVDSAVGSSVAEQIFNEYPQTTAIFASTFGIGMGVLRTARRLGVVVPDDISLVALHDSELADFLSPPLTTIALPVAKMASEAVDVLIRVIDGASPHSIVVRAPPELRLRESTARPRKAKRLKKGRRFA
jgi:LacI family transcriptional regulator, galactose operon repressor